MEKERNAKKIFDIILIMTRSKRRPRIRWKDELERDIRKLK